MRKICIMTIEDADYVGEILSSIENSYFCDIFVEDSFDYYEICVECMESDAAGIERLLACIV